MKKYKLMEILMDCLVFCLISICLSAAFLRSIHLEINLSQVLPALIALFAVLHIVFRSKRTALTILPLAAVIGFYLVYRMPEPMEWVESVVSFLEWQLAYITGKTPLRLEYVMPVTWFWVSVIGVVYFVLMIKLRWFLVPFAMGTVLLLVLWLLGHHGILWFVWLFAFGCLLVWGGNYHKKLSRRFSLPHYGLWQVYVLPLSIAVILTARILIPLDTNYTWPFLVETVDKIDEMIDDRFGFTAPRQPFRLAVTGFPSSQDQLGGPVMISRDLVLEVSSPIPLYLRGSLLNEYISTGWLDTVDDMRYRFRDSAWAQIKRSAYNFDERIWQDLGRERLEQIFPEIETTVTHVGIDGSAMFHALQLTDILTVKGASTPYFNSSGETFATRDIDADEPYTLVSRVPNMTNTDFIRYLTEEVPSFDWRMPLPDALTENEAYLEKMLAIQQNYMSVPDSVPQRVFDLTKEITAGKQSSYEKILAIQEYLQNNFSYTLTPPYTPIHRDFVDYFLFDLEEGYCTYFASAMAVMGRAAGIPTRYVEGFLMPSRPNSSGIYEVMKLNGHAWVEVYFPHAGWLPFDPTPPDALNQTAGDRAYNSGDQALYWQFYWEQMMEDQAQNVYEPSPVDISTGKPAKSTEQILIEALLGLLIAVASLFLLTVGGLIFYYKRHWSWVDEEPLQHRLHIYYSEILWYLELYETPIKQGETPYRYAKRVDEWLVSPVGSMMDIAAILVSSEFGHHKLTEKDLDQVKAFYRFLKGNIRDVMRYRQYLQKLISRMLTYRKHKGKKAEKARRAKHAEMI
jgi:transglutaminase-like putative cysteine protease